MKDLEDYTVEELVDMLNKKTDDESKEEDQEIDPNQSILNRINHEKVEEFIKVGEAVDRVTICGTCGSSSSLTVINDDEQEVEN